MKTATKESENIQTCDRNVEQWWRSLTTDASADPDQCRAQIDRWLDYRLALMREKNE